HRPRRAARPGRARARPDRRHRPLPAVALVRGHAAVAPCRPPGPRPDPSRATGQQQEDVMITTTVDSPIGPLELGTDGEWLVRIRFDGEFDPNRDRADHPLLADAAA